MKAYIWTVPKIAYGIGARKVGDDITIVFADEKPEIPSNAIFLREIEIQKGQKIEISCDRRGVEKIRRG